MSWDPMDQALGKAGDSKGASKVKAEGLEPKGAERSVGEEWMGQGTILRSWGTVRNVGEGVCFTVVLGVEFKASPRPRTPGRYSATESIPSPGMRSFIPVEGDKF